MKSFKEFLIEREVTPLDIRPLGDNWEEFVLKNCSEALTSFKHNRALYRGWSNYDSALDGPALINLTRSTRASENTSNHYTEIFDSNPNNREYPKRSKSLIASTSKSTAESFDISGLTVLLPFDNTPIGVTPGDDMWGTRFRVRDPDTQMVLHSTFINNVNEFLDEFVFKGGKVSWQRLQTLTTKLIKDIERDETSHTYENYSPSLLIAILKELQNFYDYESNQFRLVTPSNLPSGNYECWFSGKCVSVPIPILNAIVQEK